MKQSFVGIDVSKNSLDVHVLPEGLSYSFAYEPQKVKALIRKLKQLKPALIVLEATGGYEISLAVQLSAAKLNSAVVNPRQVRDYARAIGKLAKTDQVDAYVIARFAQDVKPEAREQLTLKELQLKELVMRRQQLIDIVATAGYVDAATFFAAIGTTDAAINAFQASYDALDAAGKANADTALAAYTTLVAGVPVALNLSDGTIDANDRSAELGYWIGKPWWGQGFVTEAAEAVIRHAFKVARVPRITCCHFIDNAASARVIEKLGFRCVGVNKAFCLARNAEVQTLNYERKRPMTAFLWSGAA